MKLRLALATVMTTGALMGFAAPPAAACEPPKSCGSCWVEKNIPEDPTALTDPRTWVTVQCHS